MATRSLDADALGNLFRNGVGKHIVVKGRCILAGDISPELLGNLVSSRNELGEGQMWGLINLRLIQAHASIQKDGWIMVEGEQIYPDGLGVVAVNIDNFFYGNDEFRKFFGKRRDQQFKLLLEAAGIVTENTKKRPVSLIPDMYLPETCREERSVFSPLSLPTPDIGGGNAAMNLHADVAAVSRVLRSGNAAVVPVANSDDSNIVVNKALDFTSAPFIKCDGNGFMIEIHTVNAKKGDFIRTITKFRGYLERDEAARDALNARIAVGLGWSLTTISSRRKRLAALQSAPSSSSASTTAYLADIDTDQLLTSAYTLRNERLVQHFDCASIIPDGETYLKRIQEGQKLNIVQKQQLASFVAEVEEPASKPLTVAAYKRLLANAAGGHGGVSMDVLACMREKENVSTNRGIVATEEQCHARRQLLGERMLKNEEAHDALMAGLVGSNLEETFLVAKRGKGDAAVGMDHDGEDREPLTETGKQKLQIKCISVMHLLDFLITRDRSEVNEMDNFEADVCAMRASRDSLELDDGVGRQLCDTDILMLVQDFRESRLINRANMTMKRGYSLVEKKSSRSFPVAASTVETYWYEFNKNDMKFVRDQRGQYERENLLERYDKIAEFKLRLRMETIDQHLTIDEMHQWTENVLFLNIMDDRDGKSITVGRTTVYHWMILYGAVYSVHKRCFYTDTHEKVATIKDREERWLPEMDRLSLRQACWAWIEYTEDAEGRPTESLAPAIADAMRRMKVQSHTQLIFDDSLGRRRVKVHCDFLLQYVEFRQHMLDTTGHPGLFLYPTKRVILSESLGTYYDDFDMSEDEKKERFRYVGCTHESGVCKCLRIAVLIGQDECIVTSRLASLCQWIMEHKMALRAKTDGPGVMLSQFINSYTGTSLELADDDIATINVQLKAAHPDMAAITSSPEIEYFVYGKEKMGYWDNDTFKEQVIKFRFCVEYKWPMYQIVLEVDHSSGHMAAAHDALNVSKMGMTCGGKQSRSRASQLTEECLGTHEGRKFEPGDFQTSYFTTDSKFPNNDGPPFYAPGMPRFTRDQDASELAESNARDSKKSQDKLKRFDKKVVEFAKNKNISQDSARALLLEQAKAKEDSRKINEEAKKLKDATKSVNRKKRLAKNVMDAIGAATAPLQVGFPEGPDEGNEGNERNEEENDEDDGNRLLGAVSGKVLGWNNMEKGGKQMLYERGLYEKGMLWKMGDKRIKQIETDGIMPSEEEQKTYMSYVLSQCPDFKNEVPEIQLIWEVNGGLFFPSVKGHPEIAGSGIEYLWGFVKRYYRRHNDHISAHFHTNVKVAMSQVKMRNVWSFERRTRDYGRCYHDPKACESYEILEQHRKLIKVHRCHRSMLDSDLAYLQREEHSQGDAAPTYACENDSCSQRIPKLTFPSRQKLFAHLNIEHGINLRHRCLICSCSDATFTNRKQLDNHHLQQHASPTATKTLAASKKPPNSPTSARARPDGQEPPAATAAIPMQVTDVIMNIEGGPEHFRNA